MIALYMRLSRADGDLEGVGAVSNSIANQRAMLRSFVERDPGLACQPVEEFVDDGFSGSSFDRPEVQRMLALCKEGRVSCMIVKDLSRFAREVHRRRHLHRAGLPLPAREVREHRREL